MTAYYSLVFAHTNPDFVVDNSDQIQDLISIEADLVGRLNEAGIATRHQHVSEKGALSRFAISDLPQSALKELVEVATAGMPTKLVEVIQMDGERDTGYLNGKQTRLDQMWE